MLMKMKHQQLVLIAICMITQITLEIWKLIKLPFCLLVVRIKPFCALILKYGDSIDVDNYSR
jgi:hypothetical protein